MLRFYSWTTPDNALFIQNHSNQKHLGLPTRGVMLFLPNGRPTERVEIAWQNFSLNLSTMLLWTMISLKLNGSLDAFKTTTETGLSLCNMHLCVTKASVCVYMYTQKLENNDLFKKHTLVD